MYREKPVNINRRARRNIPRGARRTRLGRNKKGGFAMLLASGSKLVTFIPWQRCLLHLSIFCFWLLVLSGMIFGARWIDQPITRVVVAGSFSNIQQLTIRAELSDVLQSSFFTLNLADIRQKLEAKPWVKKAKVERQWPDLLRVSLQEEQVAALWGQQGFVNDDGKILRPERLPPAFGLPVFYGASEQSTKMLATYRLWQDQLRTVGLEISSLRLQPRGAWQIGFAGGWTLKLGKTDVEERLQRFVSLYGKRLYEHVGNILAIDARYTQGVSVAWKVPPDTEKFPEQS